MQATKEFLQQQEQLYARRAQEIRNTPDTVCVSGTTYYVSAEGNDDLDGKTPETAWKSLERVSGTWLLPGDAVRFRRGDVFRGSVKCRGGVTYCAYGSGPKPVFCGWDENLARPDVWEAVDEEHHIWKYTKPIVDAGTLVFDDGAFHSRKLIPSYKNLQFVCREDETRVFRMEQEMTQDLDLFWEFEQWLTRKPTRGENFPIPIAGNNCFGTLYLRCDRGNPGALFRSIESVARRTAFEVPRGHRNVTVDNLCIKYYNFGVHALGLGEPAVGLHVTNCEIGWIGGTIQHYDGTDPNYLEGGRGTVTRYGNGIEIYGGCEDFLVDNCYIYQSYDAGATHQVGTDRTITMLDVRYTNNLIEDCVYGIEYFIDEPNGETGSYMDRIEMSGNILRTGGYGWGQQRHNVDTPALIKGWSHANPARRFTIHHNVFDRCAYRMIHLGARKEEYCPELHDNVYIQHKGGALGVYGSTEHGAPAELVCDEQTVAKVLCDRDASVYVIEE